MSSSVRLIALDFDGTLFGRNHKFGPDALAELRRIGELEIIRVIASGRNYFSIMQELKDVSELPIDYLITGSGALSTQVKTTETIAMHSMPWIHAKSISSELLKRKIPFYLLLPPPQSHYSFVYFGSDPCADFLRRGEKYPKNEFHFENIFGDEGDSTEEFKASGFSQFLLMTESMERAVEIEHLVMRIPDITPENTRVVHTTSAMDGVTRWIEVMPSHVSKSLAIAEIALRHQLDASQCIAVGNDTNDEDMLDWSEGGGYLVRNSPPVMQDKFFTVSKTCEEGGVAEVIRKVWPVGKENCPTGYMGEHVLFYNASTAKRFPQLAAVPQRELAAMFNVPMVDKEEEKQKELMYHEEYREKPVDLRSTRLDEGCKPFIPPNSRLAKKAIEAPCGSVFTGTDGDCELERTQRRLESREKQIKISEKPFTYGTRSEARERIQSNFYMNSVDSETAEIVREYTKDRVKQSRERIMEKQRSQERNRE